MNEDVTVVITCFDYGDYLADSVASALEQAGGEPRVVVVDDGSSEPRTLAALERLPPRVTLLRQANAGPAEARNAGLRHARTPYALLLDADDRLAADALRRLRAPLEADPTLGFSYGMIRFFGAWEGVLRMPPYDPYRLLYRHNIGLTGLVRRELLDDVGGFDPTLAGYEDWELWLHALACGWRGRRVEAVTLLHRRHGPSRHLGARPRYRASFRQLRRMHPALYSRAGRRRLRAESELGAAGRLIYRWWWGWRPLPARIELALQSWRWRARASDRERRR
jgi:glycosyltransferase involved in cell wall biosynthesis